MTTLHTDRLVLEPLLASHAPALFHGLSDDALYEFIAERPPGSLAALAERYRRLETRVSPDGREAWLNWAIRLEPAGRYLGYVQATVHAGQSAHVAYVLFRDAWGQGYAREAVTALIGHLRGEWHVTEVLATVDVRNQRSSALLEALGFERGAVRAAGEPIRGEPSDEVEYRRPCR